MNIIDREAVYIALGTDHVNKPLEQVGSATTNQTSDASEPNLSREHAEYYGKHHRSGDALFSYLAAERREEAVKPH
jgi:hypothetical protein